MKAWLVTIVVYCWIVASASAQVPFRFQIEIFPYAVDGAGDPKLPFHHLKPIVARLAQRLSSRSDHPKDLSVLRALDVVSNDSEYPSGSVLDTLWRSSHCLQILGGTVFAKSSPTILESLVYLGDLKGSIPETTLTIRTELTAEQYENFHDLFCALTLYLLAIEARIQGGGPSDVLFYLAQAESALPNSVNSSEVINSAAKELSDAIQADINALTPKGNP